MNAAQLAERLIAEVARKTVDATYMNVTVPSTTPPNYCVGDQNGFPGQYVWEIDSAGSKRERMKGDLLWRDQHEVGIS